MKTPSTSLKEIMLEIHMEPLIEITIDLEHWTMKLSAINVETLNTYTKNVETGLQVLQIL